MNAYRHISGLAVTNQARKRLVVTMPERFKNVFDAIAETPQVVLNMKLRAELIREIQAKVEVVDWTQAELLSGLALPNPEYPTC